METGLPPPKASLEASLERARARYHALLELSPDGIWILDRHGHIDEVNGVMARMLDRDAADLRGRAVYEFLPADVADETRRRLAAMEPGRRATQWQEFRLQRPDGSLLDGGVAVKSGGWTLHRPTAALNSLQSNA